VPFTLQSGGKPANYALAVNELGAEEVHRYVGHEPSGESFNCIKLSQENKPHNPLINAGAIVSISLIKRNLSPSDRFDYMLNQYRYHKALNLPRLERVRWQGVDEWGTKGPVPRVEEAVSTPGFSFLFENADLYSVHFDLLWQVRSDNICFRRIVGGEYLGFNNAVFLSEKETAHRILALGHYMKENRCFPDGVNLEETLDFYFQVQIRFIIKSIDERYVN
jgi:glutaminase